MYVCLIILKCMNVEASQNMCLENTAMIKRKCSCCFYMEEYRWYEGLFANTPKIDFFCLQLIFQVRMESTISARDFTMVP